MTVLLPTTTLHVLSPDRTLDSHGAEVTYGWQQRGPYPAHVVASTPSEDTDRERTVTGVVALVDPDAWPVRSADRLLDAGGTVWEVTGAVLVPDVPDTDAGLAHARVTARLIAET